MTGVLSGKVAVTTGAGPGRGIALAPAKEGAGVATAVAAHEWGRFRINVNAICPFANSPNGRKFAEDHPDIFEYALSRVPLRRIGDCEKDIGRSEIVLSVPDSDFITGMTIMVDGGRSVLR